MESKINFKSEEVTIEGNWNPGPEKTAAVICHPHPLYGGDMQNPVVVAAANVYARKGISTLRFNFRGTGGSTGSYDNGFGEQRDVLAAITWLQKKDITRIRLVGYSFGAWISALVVADGAPVADLVMISPPVALIDFPTPLALPSLGLVLTGQHDDIAPPSLVQSQLNHWNPKAPLKVLPGADHFFSTALTDLESALSEYSNHI